jgi:hypothetical protein
MNRYPRDPVLSKKWDQAVTLLCGSKSLAFHRDEHDAR